MEMEKILYRTIDDVPAVEEVKTEKGTERTVSGYALVFNSNSDPLGHGENFYIETILPEALDETIINSSDIFAFIDHNPMFGTLARKRYGKGKLQLEIDDKGLKYQFKVSNSPVCQQLVSYLEDEIITKSSFSFTIDQYEWMKNEDGNEKIDEKTGYPILVIKKFNRLYDVSPVFEPAYQSTESKIRSSNKYDDAIIKELQERKKNQISSDYYIKLKTKYYL
jgi:HK97 family phage prohead protease